MSDLESLIGGAPKPARRSPRAPAAPPVSDSGDIMSFEDAPDTAAGVKAHCIKQAGSGRAFIEAGMLRRPVTKNVLALIFGMDPATVSKRLLRCPEIGRAGGNRPLYDFREAVAYLVPPKMDIEEYVRSIDPNDLPNHINKVFWGAQRERLRYMAEAGEAWLTADVLDTLGEVFMLIKNRMPVLQEAMRDRGLSDAQVEALREGCEAFQNDLHAALIDMPKRKKTFSMVAAARVEGDSDVHGDEAATDGESEAA